MLIDDIFQMNRPDLELVRPNLKSALITCWEALSAQFFGSYTIEGRTGKRFVAEKYLDEKHQRGYFYAYASKSKPSNEQVKAVVSSLRRTGALAPDDIPLARGAVIGVYLLKQLESRDEAVKHACKGTYIPEQEDCHFYVIEKTWALKHPYYLTSDNGQSIRNITLSTVDENSIWEQLQNQRVFPCYY